MGLLVAAFHAMRSLSCSAVRFPFLLHESLRSGWLRRCARFLFRLLPLSIGILLPLAFQFRLVQGELQRWLSDQRSDLPRFQNQQILRDGMSQVRRNDVLLKKCWTIGPIAKLWLGYC